jgi:hypothetical protein
MGDAEETKEEIVTDELPALTPTQVAMQRIRWEVKPVPVPEGCIAVQIPKLENEGYYIAKLDAECKSCGGDGRNHEPATPGDEIRLNYCKTCILAPVDLFTKEYNRRVREARDAADAEARAERADTNLAQRLNEAHLRVVELEKQRDDVLGRNKLDAEQTKTIIEACRASEPVLKELESTYVAEFAPAAKGFTGEVKEARKWYDAERRKLDAELDSKLMEIEGRRLAFAGEYAKRGKSIVDQQEENTRQLREAEEKLKYYEAGPGKIAARFEERLKKPRETLARLKKRYES